MSKKLITHKNVEDLIKEGDSKVYIHNNMIMTPGAKEVIRNKGLTIIYRKETLVRDTHDKKMEDNQEKVLNETEKKIAKLLDDKFNVTNKRDIDKIITIVLSRLNN